MGKVSVPGIVGVFLHVEQYAARECTALQDTISVNHGLGLSGTGVVIHGTLQRVQNNSGHPSTVCIEKGVFEDVEPFISVTQDLVVEPLLRLIAKPPVGRADNASQHEYYFFVLTAVIEVSSDLCRRDDFRWHVRTLQLV